MMKKNIVSLMIVVLALFFIFFLPACSYTARLTGGEVAEIVEEMVDFDSNTLEDAVAYADNETIDLITSDEYVVVDELYNLTIDEQIYVSSDEFVQDAHCGGWWECRIHTGAFHSFCVFLSEGVVCIDAFDEWVIPLIAQRTSHYDECLMNLSTFIEHFDITRDVFQQVIDNNLFAGFWLVNQIDVLFSGDRELIEQFYSIDNMMMHHDMAQEREREYFSMRIMELQQTVFDNAEMSRYFHDVWTYIGLTGGLSFAHRWMQQLVENGNYDGVNIVAFVNYFRLTQDAFEHWVDEFDMQLFTHYNAEVIFSRDQQLIQSYYSIENEVAHTTQVQEAFEQYAATHGSPDTSWMLDR